jgi:hypothetical protein
VWAAKNISATQNIFIDRFGLGAIIFNSPQVEEEVFSVSAAAAADD